MKIIVTGGAGFIGSHIADAYLAAGHAVVVIDDLSHGSRRNVHPKVKFYKADINDAKAIVKIFKKERPEIVNHHAAEISVAESLREPAVAFKTNVLGTANVLNAFGIYGKGKNKKFIFPSSAAVYGESKKIPVDEQASPKALSPYGLSKLLGEEMIAFYARNFGFDFLIFRYANIYGPRQNSRGEAGVVAIFGRLMQEGMRPTIFGDGTKGRDYVHVSDVVAANMTATKRGKNEILNLGGGKVVTDDAVFEAVAKSTGFTQAPRYAPYRKGEIYRIALSARNAQRLLGWRPKKVFAQGVREMFGGM
jgi:UDP-glucose 4-epimerase